MTTHLSSQEFVDALEGGLDVARQHHLSACAACQTEVEALRAIVVDVETVADVPEPSPLFWDHFQARVQAAIEKLPPKQRATLMLRVYQECSHEEIATALGSTVGAVKANFFHALGNLRRLLKTS